VHDALRRLNLSVPVVLHSWTGTAEMTGMLLQLPNVYVSLSGHLTRVAPHKALPMVSEPHKQGWAPLTHRDVVGCSAAPPKRLAQPAWSPLHL
jgi:hypothetical protein